jgi:nicotinamidase-related amidase
MSYNFTPEGTVEVPQIPYKEQVLLPAEQTALIVNDMQNDFVDPNGTLLVPSASLTVPNIGKLLEKARTAGAMVVTLRIHPSRMIPSSISGRPTACKAAGAGRSSLN